MRIAEWFGYGKEQKSSVAEQYATGCETCAALRDTISRQQETIDLLERLLSEEKDERQALLERFNVIRPAEPATSNGSEVKQIRTSRIPWSHRQAKLERKSAEEARELWAERARKAAEADGGKTERENRPGPVE